MPKLCLRSHYTPWKKDTALEALQEQQGEASPPSECPSLTSEDLNVPAGHSSRSEGRCRNLMSAGWGDTELPISSSTENKSHWQQIMTYSEIKSYFNVLFFSF